MAPRLGHVPCVGDQLNCLQAENRYSHSCSKHRYSHSYTTRRHSYSRCCTSDKPHGYRGTLPVYNAKVQKNINFQFIFKKIDGQARIYRFVASLPLYAYAISINALNALTLSDFSILPRKASREPLLAYVLEASLSAYIHDTPPLVYAL